MTHISLKQLDGALKNPLYHYSVSFLGRAVLWEPMCNMNRLSILWRYNNRVVCIVDFVWYSNQARLFAEFKHTPPQQYNIPANEKFINNHITPRIRWKWQNIFSILKKGHVKRKFRWKSRKALNSQSGHNLCEHFLPAYFLKLKSMLCDSSVTQCFKGNITIKVRGNDVLLLKLKRCMIFSLSRSFHFNSMSCNIYFSWFWTCCCVAEFFWNLK